MKRKAPVETPPPPLDRFLSGERVSHSELLEAQPASAPAPTASAPPTRREEPGARVPGADPDAARRRRRLLAWVLAVCFSLLLLLNSVGLAARWASPKLALGGGAAMDGLERLLTGGEARVFRPGPARALANLLAGPVRVGVQVGHLDAFDQPDELADLRFNTGGHANGVDEVDLNLGVAQALAARLEAHGFEVDLLPATVPPGYSADLVLSVHADSSPDPSRSGYKSAHFWPARNPREAILKVAVDRAVLAATGMRDDDRNTSGNMLRYYAFNHRHFEHAVAGRTPALLVELGYLSNASDLRLLEQPDLLAAALERGVLRYLHDIGRSEWPW